MLAALAKGLVVLLGAVALSVTWGHGLIGGDYTLRVPLDSAAGLFPGSDVLIAGAAGGRVQAVDVVGDSAVATITVDPSRAPVHSDARVTVRPRSLLGEKYVALDPGTAPVTLRSGATLGKGQVAVATDLEQVFSTFDQPTRDKLQTVLIQLGGGLLGRGPGINETLAYGTSDMNDLATIGQTLAQRDAELEQVISSLDEVTAELAKSDRRAQLGQLIVNTDRLLSVLNSQDQELKRALTQTNAALGRTDTALSGTEGNLHSIVANSGRLVGITDRLTQELGNGADLAVQQLPAQIKGIRESAVVFGGKDASGYATRISVVTGTSGVGQCIAPLCPKAGSPPAVTPIYSSDADLYDFLLGRR